MDGVPKPLLPSLAGGGQQQQQQPEQPADQWAIPPTDRVAYENLFYDLAPSGELGGEAAIAFFTKSGLPSQMLAAVWQLADLTQNGSLDREEFAIAMALARKARKGIALPDHLPRSLVPESKRLLHNVTAQSQDEWATFADSSSSSSSSTHVAGVSFDQRKIVDPRTAAAVTGVTAADSSVSFSAGEMKHDGRGASQMPTFALPAASFEQRVALEGELSQAMQQRRAGTGGF